MTAAPGPRSSEAHFARGEYSIVMEPVEIRRGTWSLRFTVTRGVEVIRTVDLTKEVTFATRNEALAHGSEFVDELVRELGGG